jgi:threonine/homoserine/homoserine lactone efflux protein
MAVAAVLLPGRLAWGVYGLILGITIGLVVQQGLSSGIAHLVATLLGGFLGLFVWKPRLARATTQSARNYERDALAVSGLE